MQTMNATTAPPVEMTPPPPPMTLAQIIEAVEAPTPQEIREMWEDADVEMRVARREYVLNRAFDRGDQYVRWDSKTIDAIIREFRTEIEPEARTNINKFRARRRSLSGRLTASPLSFEGRASSAQEEGLRKKRLTEHILKYLHDTQNWQDVRAQAVLATLLGGNAAVAWEWDPHADAVPPAVDPTGVIMAGAGSVILSALTPLEFAVEPGSRTQEQATYWIKGTGMPPKQAQAWFRLEAEPVADSMQRMAPMGRLLSNQRGDSKKVDLTMVTSFYRRPTFAAPGCVVHVVNDKIVSAGSWDFPTANRLNLYVFSCDDHHESWITDPFLSDLRQPQQMYNDVRTVIREHARRCSNSRIIAQEGALEDPSVFTDAPGEVVEYAQGFDAPRWMEPPNQNRFLSAEVDRLDAEMNDLSGSPDVSRGVAPGDRNSGSALALLAEKADGPLGPIARDQANGWSTIATEVMRLIRHKLPPDEQRVTTTFGATNVPQRRVWSAADIDPDARVYVPIESTRPRSDAATRAALVDIQRSFPTVLTNLSAPMLAKMMGLGDVDNALAASNSHDLYASQENELMLGGQAVMPDEWNDHGTHIARHEQLRNSLDYDFADETFRANLDAHIQLHKQIAAQAQAQAATAQAQAGMPSAEAMSEPDDGSGMADDGTEVPPQDTPGGMQ